jgi:hypothetical protein
MGHQCGKYAQQYDTSMCDWKECYNDVKRFWMIQRGPEDLVQKNTNVYGILWKYFLWFIVISCDFLWFLDIYCDLVWFHENSWVYSSLHVNFDNRNITSQKNWVWCVSTNLKMAKKIFLIVMLVINHQIQWGGTISSDKPTWMLKVGPSSLVAPKNDAKTGWIDLERDTSDFWLYIYIIFVGGHTSLICGNRLLR